MRLVFWQNGLSPHQLPYIVHIMDDDRVNCVVIVANEATSDVRKKMGWDISFFSGLDKCEVYIAPNSQTIDYLLSYRTEDSYHLFSGLRGFQFVFHAFLCGLKYKLRRGLIVERPYTYAWGLCNGKPLWLNKIRYYTKDKKYASYIQYIFAMGKDAVLYYQSLCSRWQVFPFAYCTDQTQLTSIQKIEHKTIQPQFAFIGNLSRRKSVKTIIDACHNLNGSYCLSLVGNGNELEKLQMQVVNYHLNEKVKFLGTKSNADIPQWLLSQDILILPSIYDGWGAVVNEALGSGCYVICSDKCGARELLQNSKCGIVFRSGDNKQLSELMQQCIESIIEIRSNRSYRIKWAQQCISGSSIAKYMIDCLSEVKTQCPWI